MRCASCGNETQVLDRSQRGETFWRKRRCVRCGTWETFELNSHQLQQLLFRVRKSARAVTRIERDITLFLRGLRPEPEPRSKPGQRVVRALARKGTLTQQSTIHNEDPKHA